MNMENILFAFLLTLFAGLSTAIGGVISFAGKKNNKFLAVSLGFSAGVMVYVSMTEIFFKAKEALSADLGGKAGLWIAALAFFSGIILVAVIDKLIPKEANPHEVTDTDRAAYTHGKSRSGLLRTGLLTALAVSIHNFPEGLATFISALQDPSLGVPVAIAIAIHNIPEGVAISVPVYYATNSKKKAFAYALLSGLAEPVGALVGFALLMPFLSDMLLGIVFAAVAGIMVFVSIDELLPAAQGYAEHHYSIYGFLLGMAVMSVSLILLA
jgi:ZIP family zinc transporter